MEHPGAHWLWSRKNQFEGPCEDHVLAIKGPYFGHFREKGLMVYTQNCDIWHGASWGTLIMNQEEPIWRTLWGRFVHKRAIFGPFLGNKAIGWTYLCRSWHVKSLDTLIMIQEEPIWRTIWGPCFANKRAIIWPFLGKRDNGIHPESWNLTWTILRHIAYDSGRSNLKDPVRTMFWP